MSSELKKAIDEFTAMRGELCSFLYVLTQDNLATYTQCDNVFSFVLDERLMDSITICQGSSGMQINFPINFTPIINCEYDDLHMYNDSIVLICKSIKSNEGDDRIITIAIPVTYSLAQFFQSQKEIDIGCYTFSDDYSITYQSEQYFIPKIVNQNFLIENNMTVDNWVQLTLSGKKFKSVEENGIEIPEDYHSYLDKYADQQVDLNDYAVMAAAFMCVSPSVIMETLIANNGRIESIH
ncbi:MAG: hypothetical protein QM484_11415 [Woeseiaceae bacterium]